MSTTVASAHRRAPQPPSTSPEERLTAELIALMEAGVNPWRRPWDAAHRGSHRNLLSARPYSGGNPALLELQMTLRGSDLPLWLGYAQARQQGWFPRKGTKACLVLRPQRHQRELLDADGQPQRDEQGQPLTTCWISFRSAAVFNAAALQGEGLGDAIAAALGTASPPPEPQRLARARQILQSWPVPVVHACDRACYIPALDRIQLPPAGTFHSADEALATHCHEAIHSTGARCRLNREGITGAHAFGSDAYAREELIAELGAFLLTRRLAIGSNVQNHVAYLQHWSQILRQEPRMLLRLLADATRAANLMVPEPQEG
ncbi:MAG: zincin-like metallopeptidase domain-containing protein [Prochlorococcaceae cyanobacterium]